MIKFSGRRNMTVQPCSSWQTVWLLAHFQTGISEKNKFVNFFFYKRFDEQYLDLLCRSEICTMFKNHQPIITRKEAIRKGHFY